MLWCRGVGASQADTPVGELGVGGPDLLAAQHPAAFGALGARRQRCQVAPRSGLAEELAPQLLGPEDARQPALLLVTGAVGEQCGPHQVDRDPAHKFRRSGPRQLLLHDVVLGRAGAAPAELGRPGHADPPARGQAGLPLPQERHLLGQVLEAGREPRAVLPGQVVAQPPAQLGAELLLGGGGGQVH